MAGGNASVDDRTGRYPPDTTACALSAKSLTPFARICRAGVGIRLSPYGRFFHMPYSDANNEAYTAPSRR